MIAKTVRLKRVDLFNIRCAQWGAFGFGLAWLAMPDPWTVWADRVLHVPGMLQPFVSAAESGLHGAITGLIFGGSIGLALDGWDRSQPSPPGTQP
jgi:hypothetical protein